MLRCSSSNAAGRYLVRIVEIGKVRFQKRQSFRNLSENRPHFFSGADVAQLLCNSKGRRLIDQGLVFHVAQTNLFLSDLVWIVSIVFVIVQFRDGCVDQRFAERRRHILGH